MKSMHLLTLASATALLLCSCNLSFKQTQPLPSPQLRDDIAKKKIADRVLASLFTNAPKEPEKVEPTPEQRAAGRKAITAARAAAEAEINTAATPTVEHDTDTTEVSTGGLRLRRFAPPEEAVSAEEGSDVPLPNAAELHGLRSPELRTDTLPMDINGKIIPAQSQQ